MKHLKKFNEEFIIDLMGEYVGKPLFCTRPMSKSISVNCGIFTNKNIGGFGLGIRGDYFDEVNFEAALSKKGDSLGRKLYTADEFDLLAKDLKLDTTDRERAINQIVDMIEMERGRMSSSKPDLERREGVYIELEQIKDLLSKPYWLNY